MNPAWEHEPIRGLPEPLPPGERILWQGTPSWRALARRALHVDKLALYFALLLLVRGATALADGSGMAGALIAMLELSPLALAALGVLTLLAWLMGRATVYTITDRRVVLRIGIALPLVINLPFKIVRAAGLRTFADGTGDLPLTLAETGKLGFIHLWPHARPWRLSRPEPMLRAVPDAAQVATILARALAAAAGQPVRPVAEATPVAEAAPVAAGETAGLAGLAA